MGTSMKAGGIAALVQAFCYVCGFAMIATILNPGNTEGWGDAQKLQFILERKGIIQLWNIIIYVLFGTALVVLAATLHGLLRRSSANLMSIATPFGLIWAGLVIASGMIANVGLETVAETYLQNVGEAVEAWRILGAVQDGLGGGVEFVGGVWVLLVSIASLRSGEHFPKALNLVGLFVGAAGILTIVPVFGDLGAVFGISQIIWFIYLAVVLLRGGNAQQVVVADS